MRRSRVSLGLALILLLAMPASSAQAASEEAKVLYRQAVDAYRSKDYAGFLASARKMLVLETSNPKYLYNVACAESLTGDNPGSAGHLLAILDQGLDLGIEEDADLAGVRASKEFEPVRKKLDLLRRPIGSAEIAFTLPEKDQIPEGIAYDPVGRTWFVSSVHKRKIVARAADGTASDFTKEGQDGLWSVLALAVDAGRRRLWACSAALPEMDAWDKALQGRSGVFEYDLATGRLLRKYLLPVDAHPRALGDLTISSAGDVYLTDGAGSGLYRILRSKDAIEEFIAPGVFTSPQGLAFTPGERSLYVADYGGGLWAVDAATGTRRNVAAPDNVPLLGIDGLAAYGNSLIVTQNGIRPHRVTRLTLDPAGERVVKGEILEMNDPRFSEPTLGMVVGDAYYFVANSQWGMFDKDGVLAPVERLKAPIILKVPLPGR